MSSLVTEPEHGVMIARLAAVVKKEEPIEGILKIVRKYENGIRHEKLLMMLNKLGYPVKVIRQLTYLGLIAQTNADGRSFYRITEKGCEVLEAYKC